MNTLGCAPALSPLRSITLALAVNNPFVVITTNNRGERDYDDKHKEGGKDGSGKDMMGNADDEEGSVRREDKREEGWMVTRG